MKQEYEAKRMQYNLLVNELKTLKERHEKKIDNISEDEYKKTLKENEKKEKELKEEVEKIFNENKVIISKEILVENNLVEKEYDYYQDEVIREDDKTFKRIKEKSEIEKDFEEVQKKIENRKENNVIPELMYNELTKCLGIYKKEIIDNYDLIKKEKYVTSKDIKNIKKSKEKKKVSSFMGLFLPLTLLDIVLIIYSLVINGECKIEISQFFCSITILSFFYTRVITPVLIIYYIIMIINKYKKKVKK